MQCRDLRYFANLSSLETILAQKHCANRTWYTTIFSELYALCEDAYDIQHDSTSRANVELLLSRIYVCRIILTLLIYICIVLVDTLR